MALAPTPHQQGHLISPFPKGEIKLPADKDAPSRAFAKLVEAELRLGHSIQAGDLCVDLGAAPGSWTYTAVNRGARVIAVDRSPLRDDLMRHAQVRFEAADVFRFRSPETIDWLLCDVIASAERTTELLAEWLQSGKCRQFVVTLKLKDGAEVEMLSQAKARLPGLTRKLFITRLCANKREVCVFGSAR
jgi:23S rRNA (cytidine2498-2'-O)-methyltransferase